MCNCAYLKNPIEHVDEVEEVIELRSNIESEETEVPEYYLDNDTSFSTVPDYSPESPYGYEYSPMPYSPSHEPEYEEQENLPYEPSSSPNSPSYEPTIEQDIEEPYSPYMSTNSPSYEPYSPTPINELEAMDEEENSIIEINENGEPIGMQENYHWITHRPIEIEENSHWMTDQENPENEEEIIFIEKILRLPVKRVREEIQQMEIEQNEEEVIFIEKNLRLPVKRRREE